MKIDWNLCIQTWPRIERPEPTIKPSPLPGVDIQLDETIPLGEIHVVDQVTGQRQIIKVQHD